MNYGLHRQEKKQTKAWNLRRGSGCVDLIALAPDTKAEGSILSGGQPDDDPCQEIPEKTWKADWQIGFSFLLMGWPRIGRPVEGTFGGWTLAAR